VDSCDEVEDICVNKPRAKSFLGRFFILLSSRNQLIKIRMVLQKNREIVTITMPPLIRVPLTLHTTALIRTAVVLM
jgi:hypothetical protein